MVTGEPELALQHTDSATQGHPGDADGETGAAGHAAVGLSERGVDGPQGGPGADGGGAVRPDLHGRQTPEVKGETAGRR